MLVPLATGHGRRGLRDRRGGRALDGGERRQGPALQRGPGEGNVRQPRQLAGPPLRPRGHSDLAHGVVLDAVVRAVLVCAAVLSHAVLPLVWMVTVLRK